MSWVVREPSAENAFNAWLDIDQTVDPSLALHVRNWLEGFVELGPERRDCLVLDNDGDRRTVLVSQTKVRVTFRVDLERQEIDIRSIGRPTGSRAPF
jgi:hypothetical protein